MKTERASAGDVDALVQLRLDFLREDRGGLDGETEAALRAQLPGYFRETLNRTLFAYLLREGDAVVSCAFLLVVLKPMSPAFPNGRTGTVLNVYTRPAFRRMGCARKAMEALLKDAEAMELSAIELKATKAGYALYRSLGFSDADASYRPMRWDGPGKK